ncbi:MAG: ABC transporter permease [Acidobacteriia bacterium]|nr:ABC transporter permease [Terriglobia bacterium]
MQHLPAGVVAPAPAVTLIAPSRGLSAVNLREIWEYRELLYFLAWRDIKVRYKQTALGAAWALLQPLFLMAIFTLLFSRVAKVPVSVPYPIFAFCGLLPWQLFAFGLSQSSNSLVQSQNLISKVYFPRLVIPIASVLAGLLDFAIAFLLLLAMMAYYRVPPGKGVILLPVFVLFAVITSLTAGVWLSAINVRYRDVQYTLGFLVQFWMLATPVGYPASVVPARWRWVLVLNPMAGVVEGFRWALLGTGPSPGAMLGVSVGLVLLLLIAGLHYFRRMEKTFADIV